LKCWSFSEAAIKFKTLQFEFYLRSRGVTIDVAQTKFETEKKIVNLLDAPGHKDFIPNMITGASIADCAILVINSTKGEFETGFEQGGQTREHSLLIRSLGISQLAVAVNKMDTCDWSKQRFDEICVKMGSFLKQVGYKENELAFIPCSGLMGENLTKKPENCPLNQWYTGGTILDCINNFLSPERRIEKPLRISVTDIFRSAQSSLASLAGKVETGYVNVGDKVLIMPSGQTGIIKSIASEEDMIKCAYAGDSIVLNIPNIETNTIAVGDIICDCVNDPIKLTNLIKGRIILFNIDVPLTKGYPVCTPLYSALPFEFT
jgi:elongation factor 1 alpha-like protein